jgi:hypothetical protein
MVVGLRGDHDLLHARQKLLRLGRRDRKPAARLGYAEGSDESGLAADPARLG